tara:strand:+ start:2911 stop:4401 length:1491 start_codon:yes stop_codon:yes gene_type:complete
MKQFLIIPLGGLGKRFQEAGYKTYKPFLKISKKIRVIDNIINNFPKSTHLIIIGNEKKFKNIIKKIKRKKTSFIKIKNHNSGPIFSLFLARKKIKKIIRDDPFYISYSDINWEWNYKDIEKFVKTKKIVVFSHKGFHPHLEVDKKSDFFLSNFKKELTKVSEKKPISKDYKRDNLAIGCYYFKNFEYIEKFFDSKSFKKNFQKKEIYIINLLNYYLKSKIKINFLNLKRFVHLGIPSQYESFLGWKNILNDNYKKYLNLKFHAIMLMSGEGRRVKSLREKKPFLKIRSEKIYEYIFKKFGSKKNFIITNNNYINFIKKKFKVYKIKKTRSMLQTIEKSLNFLKNKKNFFILSCDCFADFESNKFKKFIKSKNPDVVLFTFKISKLQKLLSNSHTTIEIFENRINSINVKKFTNNKNELGHAGFFWIKNQKVFNYIKEFHFRTNISRENLLDDYFKFLFDENLCKVNHFNLKEYVHIGSVKEYEELKYWDNYFKNEN